MAPARGLLWVWADEQGQLMDKLRDQPLDLAGDGRCDSPGFSAKYLTYSLYAAQANKILHFEQIQCEAVRNSGQMEKEGLIRSLEFVKGKDLTVRSLTTDRHRSIAKHMREQEAAILHYFDIWHVSKSIKKSLTAASKGKDCGVLALWSQPAVNHMYWVAAASQGNGDLLVDAWTSITRHVTNIHEGHPGLYTRTRLAALHFNENSDREQATTQAGDLQWKLKSPKARKGHHDVNPRLTPTTYGYVTKLLVESVTLCETALPLREAFQLDAATPRPPCMSHGFVRPAKEDLVAARVSRFGKRAPTIAQ
ncbi:hypothetical protein HPB47_013333 [Ixodes persulcatus]|uniref:Uncharacterized protein n=1 Tax=Ixodes persulcatus TaxID=34615 RepID=A0AC60QYR6_IXOPE|nr:hypothetical protein HPB47_013333 [Ixodes persulcatus]